MNLIEQYDNEIAVAEQNRYYSKSSHLLNEIFNKLIELKDKSLYDKANKLLKREINSILLKPNAINVYSSYSRIKLSTFITSMIRYKIFIDNKDVYLAYIKNFSITKMEYEDGILKVYATAGIEAIDTEKQNKRILQEVIDSKISLEDVQRSGSIFFDYRIKPHVPRDVSYHELDVDDIIDLVKYSEDSELIKVVEIIKDNKLPVDIQYLNKILTYIDTTEFIILTLDTVYQELELMEEVKSKLQNILLSKYSTDRDKIKARANIEKTNKLEKTVEELEDLLDKYE